MISSEMGCASGAEWVEACIGWTAKAVVEEMHRFASAAVVARGALESAGRESCDSASIGELFDSGRGAGFVVMLGGRGMFPGGTRSEIVFQTAGEDGEPWGDLDRIIARTSRVVRGREQPEVKKTARLGLDCATGEPCLVVARAVDGRETDGGRQVTVEEFVREVLLAVLFPDLVAVDHSRAAGLAPQVGAAG